MDGGLRKFRAQRAALDAGEAVKVDVLCLGDSITEGAGGGNSLASWSSWRDYGYVGVLRSLTAARWGDVGAGTIPMYAGENTNPSVPAWTLSGSGWSYDGTFGPAGRSRLNNFASGGNSTATAQISFVGSGITVWMVRGSITCKLNFSIDGGAATTFDSYSASNQHYGYTIGGLTDGAHTLTISYGGASASNSGATYAWLVGATPIRGTRGMVLHNLGYYGRMASDFALSEDNL